MKATKTLRNFAECSEETIREKIKRNPSIGFLPVNTKGDDFDWDAVIGCLLVFIKEKSVGKYTYEQFYNDASVAPKFADTPLLWSMLSKAYFEQQNILSIAPEFLMLRANSASAASTRIAKFYFDLLGGTQVNFMQEQLNFIEKIFVELLESKLKEDSSRKTSEVYLPFMADLFQKDFLWLAKKSKYFLKEKQNFLTLYAFLYAAQLGLSVADWATGQCPQVKPLFFILENEKASKERTSVQNYGYKTYDFGIKKLFPFLTMNEILQVDNEQKLPLWKFFYALKEVPEQQDILLNALARLRSAFIADRNLETGELNTPQDLEDAIKTLCTLSLQQFNDKRSSKHGIHDKYAKSIRIYFSDAFTRSRGRSGKVLVIPHDIILLLTNIIIADNEKLRFCEVVQEFKARGVFLDKQSEQELIVFYERMGNVKRLSDSGDAVYVCKTI